MDKQYLNKKYSGQRVPTESIPGTKLQAMVKHKKGRQPPPTVTWLVTREASDDGIFVKDPVFTERVDDTPTHETRWETIEIANVAGQRYTVKAVVGGVERELQTVETWRRYYLNVTAQTREQYALFKDALKIAQASLAQAFISIVRNKATVAGEAKETTDDSKAGREGKLLTISLVAPTWDPMGVDYKPKIENGAVTGAKMARLEGTTLVIEFPEDAEMKFDPSPEHVTAFKASVGDQVIASLTNHSGLDGADRLARAVTRRSDTKVEIDLTSAAFDERWVYSPHGSRWEATPVDQRVGAALTANRVVELEIHVNYSIFGANAGGTAMGSTNIDLVVFEGTTAAKLAAVLVHEFAHTCGMVRPSSVSSYGAESTTYRSTDAARPVVRTTYTNNDHHTADYGGSGAHCSYGCKRIESPSTNSGFTFEPDPTSGKKLCTMHFGNLDPVERARFCSNCVAQLRRA